MRISSSNFTDGFVNQLSVLSNQRNQLQLQASSGQRIENPEDDPAAIAQALNLQGESGALTQYQKNISTLTGTVTASYSAINGLNTVSNRASEIAALADGTRSQSDLNNYATEINQLIQQAVQTANAKVGDTYLFGGTQNTSPPFTLATDSNGNVTGVTYNGNTSVPSVEIAPGVTLSGQIPGANSSGSGPAGLITDTRTGADFFNHLIALRNDLQTGNTAAISSTDAPALARDENNLVEQVASNGAVQAQLESAASQAASRTNALSQQYSTTVDADLAQTMTRLSQTQNAYQAALQSGASIMNVSLLDYLK